MTTVNYQVGASTDDARERQDDVSFSATATDCYFIADTTAATRWQSGFRFTNVQIPKGAVISSATIEGYIKSSYWDDPNVAIACHDVDDSSTFTSIADVHNRVRTSAGITWSGTGVGTGWQTSTDFDTALQEVIDRSGYSPNNDISVLMTGNNAPTSNAQFYGYDYSSSLAAKLQVTYTVVEQSIDIDIEFSQTIVFENVKPIQSVTTSFDMGSDDDREVLSNLKTPTVETSITLGDQILAIAERYSTGPLQRGVKTEITFDSDVDYSPKKEAVSSSLTFSHDAESDPFQEIVDSVEFSQTIQPSGDFTVEVSHSLTFDDSTHAFGPQSVITSITFTGQPDIALEDPTNFKFSQTITHEVTHRAATDIQISQTIGYGHDQARAITLSINFSQSILATVSTDNACIYNPAISGSDDRLPPNTLSLSKQSEITLYQAAAGTITLRNPEFGNQLIADTASILNKTLSGHHIAFRDNQWPAYRRFNVVCTQLQRTVVENYIIFLEDTLGQQIRFTDHENRQWDGIVINPDEAVTFSQTCKNAVSFMFEGSLVGGN